MFEVTLTVVVDADNLEQAKANAIEYFQQVDEIKDEEIREDEVMQLLEIGQIKAFREMLEDESIDLESLSMIDTAFDELVESGAELRDLPENAMAVDKLDEIEDAIPELAYIMYDYVEDNFGDADDPCYYLTPFAFHILERQAEATK